MNLQIYIHICKNGVDSSSVENGWVKFFLIVRNCQKKDFRKKTFEKPTEKSGNWANFAFRVFFRKYAFLN